MSGEGRAAPETRPGPVSRLLREEHIPRKLLFVLNFGWFVSLALILLGKAPDIDFFLKSLDHGYQLSMGRQILFGKFPFVDLFTHYGPMVPFTSAIGLAIQDSLIPEIVICSAGYTLAVFTIFRLILRHTQSSAALRIGLALAMSLVAIAHLARLYKWYYWLFPLLVIACLDNAYASRKGETPNRKWLFLAGLTAGVGALYRLDMGVASTAAAVLATGIILWPAGAHIKVIARHALLPVAGFCIPMFLWLFTLVVIAGGSPLDYFGAFFSGASGAVSAWSIPFPGFKISEPLDKESGLFLALILMAAAYLFVLAAGARRGWRKAEPFNSPEKFLIIVAAVGLALYPQAMHRTSAFSFLQIIPPLVVLVPTLGAHVWKFGLRRSPDAPPRLAVARAGVVIYVLIAAVSSFGIRAGVEPDLQPFGHDIGTRYRQLHAMANPEHPSSQLAETVKQFCPEDQSVLPIGLIAYGYTFERRVSGIFPFYVTGIFDSPAWLERDMESIRSDPPGFVLVTRPNLRMDGTPKGRLRKHIEWVNRNYDVVPESRDGHIVMYVRQGTLD